MSSKLVSTFELSRNVAKIIESQFEPSSQQKGFFNTVVTKVIATYSKYVAHTLTNNSERHIMIDIPVLGQLIMSKSEDEGYYGGSDFQFIPSVVMQQACMVQKQPMRHINESEMIRKDLKIEKIAEVAHIGVDQATAVMNVIVMQMGALIKQGRSVALDFQLPSDKFLVISQNGIEFQNKNGIAEMVYTSSKSGSSSIQKLNELRAQQEMLTTPRSNRSTFSKRTLSIAVKGDVGDDMYNNSTPRGARTIKNKRMSESKDGMKGRYLNDSNLLVIDRTRPNHAIGDSERFEIRSRISQTSKYSQKPTSIRLPSIQGDHKNGRIASDLLSQKSRLSNQSKVLSQSGQSAYKPRSIISNLREIEEENAVNATMKTQESFAAAAPPIFMNPADLDVQKKKDYMSIQDDLLMKIIQKRRVKEQEKQEKWKYEEQKNEIVNSEHTKIQEQEKLEKKVKQMTLKERLYEQKLERLNEKQQQDKLSKVPNKVHFPYTKNQRKELMIHRFEDKNMQDKIENQNNNQRIDLELLADSPITMNDKIKESVKSSSSKAQISEDLSQLRALGKFTDRDNSKNLLDGHEKYQYDLLMKNMQEIDVVNDAEERVGVKLERERQQKIVERIEFEKQIELFNQKELLKAMKRKEEQQANHQYWKRQIREAQGRSEVNKLIDASGGVQADFLTKMFKFQEYMDPQPDSASKSKNSEISSKISPADYQDDVPHSNSRMKVDHKKIQQDIKSQIEHNNNVKVELKLKDIEFGKKMTNNALASLEGEDQFNSIKKMKAREIMTKQWGEQQQVKNNEEVVERIFT